MEFKFKETLKELRVKKGITQEQLDSKNYYAINPSFDRCGKKK